MWKYRGEQRPKFATVPGPGQESVWDYPRPPALVPDRRLVEVYDGGRPISATRAAYRILETASPPTVYFPPEDVDREVLAPAPGSSLCEWKGSALYWALADDPGASIVGWSYPHPSPAYERIRGYFSFYPAALECCVSGERVRPQPGGFYGGWITDEIVGPFKGQPGTEGW